ncbi:MAG: hypothetical protein V1722_02960 [Candidatus Micrarchaeota archaeon]
MAKVNFKTKNKNKISKQQHNKLFVAAIIALIAIGILYFGASPTGYYTFKQTFSSVDAQTALVTSSMDKWLPTNYAKTGLSDTLEISIETKTINNKQLTVATFKTSNTNIKAGTRTAKEHYLVLDGSDNVLIGKITQADDPRQERITDLRTSQSTTSTILFTNIQNSVFAITNKDVILQTSQPISIRISGKRVASGSSSTGNAQIQILDDTTNPKGLWIITLGKKSGTRETWLITKTEYKLYFADNNEFQTSTTPGDATQLNPTLPTFPMLPIVGFTSQPGTKLTSKTTSKVTLSIKNLATNYQVKCDNSNSKDVTLIYPSTTPEVAWKTKVQKLAKCEGNILKTYECVENLAIKEKEQLCTTGCDATAKKCKDNSAMQPANAAGSAAVGEQPKLLITKTHPTSLQIALSDRSLFNSPNIDVLELAASNGATIITPNGETNIIKIIVYAADNVNFPLVGQVLDANNRHVANLTEKIYPSGTTNYNDALDSNSLGANKEIQLKVQDKTTPIYINGYEYGETKKYAVLTQILDEYNQQTGAGTAWAFDFDASGNTFKEKTYVYTYTKQNGPHLATNQSELSEYYPQEITENRATANKIITYTKNNPSQVSLNFKTSAAAQGNAAGQNSQAGSANYKLTIKKIYQQTFSSINMGNQGPNYVNVNLAVVMFSLNKGSIRLGTNIDKQEVYLVTNAPNDKQELVGRLLYLNGNGYDYFNLRSSNTAYGNLQNTNTFKTSPTSLKISLKIGDKLIPVAITGVRPGEQGDAATIQIFNSYDTTTEKGMNWKLAFGKASQTESEYSAHTKYIQANGAHYISGNTRPAGVVETVISGTSTADNGVEFKKEGSQKPYTYTLNKLENIVLPFAMASASGGNTGGQAGNNPAGQNNQPVGGNAAAQAASNTLIVNNNPTRVQLSNNYKLDASFTKGVGKFHESNGVTDASLNVIEIKAGQITFGGSDCGDTIYLVTVSDEANGKPYTGSVLCYDFQINNWTATALRKPANTNDAYTNVKADYTIDEATQIQIRKSEGYVTMSVALIGTSTEFQIADATNALPQDNYAKARFGYWKLQIASNSKTVKYKIYDSSALYFEHLLQVNPEIGTNILNMPISSDKIDGFRSPTGFKVTTNTNGLHLIETQEQDGFNFACTLYENGKGITMAYPSVQPTITRSLRNVCNEQDQVTRIWEYSCNEAGYGEATTYSCTGQCNVDKTECTGDKTQTGTGISDTPLGFSDQQISEMPQCFDSDGGRTANIAGYVLVRGNAQRDSCIEGDNSKITEYYCTRPRAGVREVKSRILSCPAQKQCKTLLDSVGVFGAYCG